MLIRLNPGSGHPMYVQIAEAITVQIEDGSLVKGDRLPPARVLAESVGVNMHTVLKAYEHLATKGLVEMRRGRGGVVVRSGVSVRGLVASLAEAARSQGMSRPEVVRLLEEEW